MNGKRAKKLRRLIGYHPTMARVYDFGQARVLKDPATGAVVGGLADTIKLDKCKRNEYQRVKRSGVAKILAGATHG